MKISAYYKINFFLLCVFRPSPSSSVSTTSDMAPPPSGHFPCDLFGLGSFAASRQLQGQKQSEKKKFTSLSNIDLYSAPSTVTANPVRR
jgi:hypothetical protein